MSRAARLTGGTPFGTRTGSVRSPGRVASRELPVATLADLLAAACAAGAPVTGALTGVGGCVPGRRGDDLARAAAGLARGADWPAAWHGTDPELAPVAAALRMAWEEGAPPGDALRAAARELRREQHAAALDAGARLGVRLVLPLGLCHLPAFVLVGLVPVLVSLGAASLGR